MRAIIMAVALVVGLISLPAHADHRSHTYVNFGVGFGYPGGYGYGYPGGYGYPYGYYRPYYSPWYGYPSVGVGVQVSPRKARTEAPAAEQRSLKMYVYPAAGQTDAQLAEDRYQCHVWATGQSGYDPTLGTGSRDDADGYTRAFTACMQGRNYVVK